MSDRLLYETHSHTPLCGHARGEPEDYAEVAWHRGLRGLTVTCHNPMPDGFSAHVRMSPDDFDRYVDMVARAREAWEGRVDVRLGLECDWFPGYESFLERQIGGTDLEYVIGSVHPQTPEFRARFWTGDPRSYQRTYFDQLATAAETGLFDCISHPDLVKNETAEDWDLERIYGDVLAALDRIARTGVAMELNTSGANKRIPEMNPAPTILRAMRERGIPVVLGADAHVPERVGDRFHSALRLLEASGYEEVSCFLGRERRDIPLRAAMASLR